MTTTNTIQIPDMFSIQMVQTHLNAKWSSFWMPFKFQIPDHLITIQMTVQISGWYSNDLTPYNVDHSKFGCHFVQISNVCASRF